jgi:hypothetical protein
MLYLVIAFTVIGLAAWVAANFKRFSALKQSVASAAQEVAAALEARQEKTNLLLGQLAEVLGKVPELTNKLKEALLRATEARSRSLPDRSAVEDELTESIGLLFEELERNEVVAADQRYTKLRDEVLDAEDRLNLIRQKYNDLAVRYNVQQTLYPVKWFATNLGATTVPEFDIEDLFERHPLQIKGTMPTPRRSLILGGGEGNQSNN